jgi:hypothetical protein
MVLLVHLEVTVCDFKLSFVANAFSANRALFPRVRFLAHAAGLMPEDRLRVATFRVR